VVALARLLPAMLPKIDIPRALLRRTAGGDINPPAGID
jgi:hypothetical protein